MRRFSLWLRGKPLIADAMLAGIFLILEIITLPRSDAPIVYGAVGIALCLPIVLRRRNPSLAALLVLIASIAATFSTWRWESDVTVAHPALFMLAVSLYSLVAYVGRLHGAIFAVGLLVDSVLSVWLLSQEVLSTALFVALFYALSWIFAEFLGARRLYDEEVAVRLEIAESARDRRAEDAVALERTRIARELHDVVAHAVSVMIVQADGATYAMRKDPDKAEQALGNISATGRQALSELRRTVALLRTEQVPEELPQHGTAGIAKVVELMRNAGLPVQLELSGQLDDISAAMSLGVHRVVQESLTNVLRHAGKGAKAQVKVHRRATDVLVEISDHGHPESTFRDGGGNGLVGMRERVAVLHGTLEAGKRADGGWLVRAVLPLQPDDDNGVPKQPSAPAT